MEKQNKYCEYKGLTLGKEEFVSVTDEEVKARLEEYASKCPITNSKEGKSSLGDTINIDFEGFIEGVPFDGGKAEGYDLELGSGTFIPGFEDQLVGYEKGTNVDVKVTFPENYQAENLKGKEAIFKCKVNDIKVKSIPEVNDEFALSQGFKTAQELFEAMKAQMNNQKQNELAQKYINKVDDYLVANSEIEVSEDAKNKCLDNMIKYYEDAVKQYGMTFEQYMQMAGDTLETFKEKMTGPAISTCKIDEIYKHIIEVEKIEVTDEEITEELEFIKHQYQMDDKQLEEFKNEHLSEMKEEISRQKVARLIYTENN